MLKFPISITLLLFTYIGQLNALQLITLGDSLTYGDGDSKYTSNDIPLGYPERLTQSLHNNFSKVTLNNFARNGWSINELVDGSDWDGPGQLNKALEIINTATINNEKNITLVWIGANDILSLFKWYKTQSDLTDDIENYRLYIKTIFERLHKSGTSIFIALIDDLSKRPVLADSNFASEDFAEITSDKLPLMTNQVQQYNQIINSLASQYNVKIIDMYNTSIFSQAATMAEDGLHPNASGYDQIASLWYNKIIQPETHLYDSDFHHSNRLFDWAEMTYPDIFKPAGTVTQQIDKLAYRHYSSTNTYLATLDNYVYVYAQWYSPEPVLISRISDLLPAREINWYQPPVKVSWQWQLSGPLNQSYNVEIYDIDLFDNSKEAISALKNKGIKVICYFSAGSYENWRPDAVQFPKHVIGAQLDEWEGEKWLDIRSNEVRDIMAERLKSAAQKGCDGVEPDNMDAYKNISGFNLNENDQLAFNRFIADQAHASGLSVGLKNDLEQIDQLKDYYDFAVNEQCFEFNECASLSAFIQLNKPVLNTEYLNKYITDTSARALLCQESLNLYFSTLILPIELDDSFRFSCL